MLKMYCILSLFLQDLKICTIDICGWGPNDTVAPELTTLVESNQVQYRKRMFSWGIK